MTFYSWTAIQRLLKFGYLLTHDELFEHTRVLIKPSFNNPIPQISRSWLAKFVIYIRHFHCPQINSLEAKLHFRNKTKAYNLNSKYDSIATVG